MAKSIEDIRKVLPGVRKELMSKANVVATGIGYKKTAGKKTDELCIVCSVDTKISKNKLSAQDLIPSSVQSVSTDVVRTGLFRTLQDPTGRFRPAPGGVSIGHKDITAGTFGCVVKKNDTLFILSNNHVLANSNAAEIGDEILQPGPHDGGTLPADHIANLSEFVPVTFDGQGGADPCGIAGGVAAFLNGIAGILGSKTRLYQTRNIQAENLVDCAIAEPLDQNDIKNEILNIGQIGGVDEATVGMAIKKSGRTTGFTEDTVDQIDVTVRVNFGSGRIATFVDQILTGPMSQGGDSGSAIINDQNKIVGLLFAGSDTSTIFCRIQNVFQLLGVTLP